MLSRTAGPSHNNASYVVGGVGVICENATITHYFPLYFLKQTWGGAQDVYIYSLLLSVSSRHRETNFLWHDSGDDTGVCVGGSEVRQRCHGKTGLYLFRA